MSKVTNIVWVVIAVALMFSCKDGKTNTNRTASPPNQLSESTPSTPPNSASTDNNNNTPSSDNDQPPSIPSKPLLPHTRLCTPNPVSDSLRTILRGQEADFWCWAASGQMVMGTLGRSVDQCDEANRQFGRRDCCNSQTPIDCDNVGWPDFNAYDFDADHTTDKEISWDEVKNQIACRRSPFCATWKWTDPDGQPSGAGHMMVVIGYKVDRGERFVKILDPLPRRIGHGRWVTYLEYVSGTGHAHWDDYYNVRKKQNN